MNITSTVKLREEMIEKIDGEYNYLYVEKENMTGKIKAETDIFVTYGGDLTDGEAEQFENLKWVHVMSAGIDEIPKEIFDKAIVTNSTGIHKIPMTEFAVGLLLQYYKNFNQLHEAQNKKEWITYSRSEELYGKEAHILGTGSIGSHLAKALQIFGVRTVGYNTNGRLIEGFDQTHAISELNSQIGSADIMVNILPSTRETTNFLQTATFKAMKDEAVFLNIGRGTVMTDEVLIEVLEQKYIAHVLSDVFNEEPLPADSPLYTFDNLTITPHCSAKTRMYNFRAFDIFTFNLERMNNESEMKNVIDYNKGY
ncbi:MAG TPA: D-2-hydroxyacid dehydrogenase [Jeotgalicoccus sp.]|nr:NAD(P)-dependent oxidoreductase [Jeotgalicoccus sp.]HBV24138.1 D-2-hydroxyacid dehydrogenase [Jeotgalicoccus sp.]